MDKLSREKRSKVMSSVHSKDTKPEKIVRQLVYSLGYRYRLHVRKLPGQPDLVFSGRHKVIFVHGCFWHYHESCSSVRLPKSNLDYWIPKLEGNKARDSQNIDKLISLGWEVLVVWECELNNMNLLSDRIKSFLDAKDS